MAAELLQLLDFARSQDAQNVLQASVAQNAYCINQHATIINQHTADLAELTTTTQQQDRSIRILAANDDASPGYGTRNPGSCWRPIFVVGFAGVLWIGHLQKRIKQLEPMVSRSPDAVS